MKMSEERQPREWLNNYPRNEKEWRHFTEAMSIFSKEDLEYEIAFTELLIELKRLSIGERRKRFSQAWENREFSHYDLARVMYPKTPHKFIQQSHSILRFSEKSLQRKLDIMKQALAKGE